MPTSHLKNLHRNTTVIKFSTCETLGRGSIARGNQVFYSGPVECIRKVYAHRGLRTLYTGFLVMGIRDLPALVVYMGVYESLFLRLHKSSFTDDSGVLASLLAGGTAGVMSWGVIMPLDVIKSNLQADFSRVKYKGMVDCAQQVYKLGGFKAFFSGFVVNSIRAFPVNAVTFLFYSQMLKFLNKESQSTAKVEEG